MAKKIFLSMGDPRGIGPNIIFRSLKEIRTKGVEINIVGDQKLLLKEADMQGFDTDKIKIIQVKSSDHPGADSLSYIDRALEETLNAPSAALVTGPVEKKSVAEIEKKFIGHTEYIAARCEAPNAIMSFISDKIKISLLSTHIPICRVGKKIKKDKIIRHIRVVDRVLKKYFKINSPAIALCSLNPHCGENGLFGGEEKREMIPALEELNSEGIWVEGPFSASFALKQTLGGKYDFAVSAYHDQLLPAVKAIFTPSVNLTMGLPFPRTSPDHGPALDLKPSDKADHRSMKKAIEIAVFLSV